MTYNEEVADFRKVEFITDKDYWLKRKDFLGAPAAVKAKTFFKFCKAVINQHSNGTLSIREASYAIASCDKDEYENPLITTVVQEAICLRRHPSNYKLDHKAGWSKFVKLIDSLS